MGLGGKVQDRVNLFRLHHVIQQVTRLDIPLDELWSGGPGSEGGIVRVPSEALEGSPNRRSDRHFSL